MTSSSDNIAQTPRCNENIRTYTDALHRRSLMRCCWLQLATAVYVLYKIGSSVENYNSSKAANAVVAHRQDVLKRFVTNYTAAMSSSLLQSCLDEYTSRGLWVEDRWVSPVTMKHACPSFNKYQQSEDISVALANLTIGYMGDSTTRSDLRAWEEQFGCPRTDLDEASVFQRKNPDGGYRCKHEEQSINLTKCGIPPIVNITRCPDESSVSFRYFYKVNAWTPLDKWYFEHQPSLFDDIDVLVVSVGRWFPYQRRTNKTHDIEQFIVELQKIYSGLILFQSQYAAHTVSVEQSKHPVSCTHGLLKGKYQCEETVTLDRPKEDDEIRSVVEQHQIVYLDRWNISKSLPLAYYNTWLCGKPSFHSWYCDHHLSFVAMEHFRMVASIIPR